MSLLDCLLALPFPFVCTLVIAGALGVVWLASAREFDRRHRRG